MLHTQAPLRLAVIEAATLSVLLNETILEAVQKSWKFSERRREKVEK